MGKKLPTKTPAKPACDAPGSLVTRTLILLQNDERSLPAISRQSGIPFYWLRSFKENRVPSPNVNRVQRLYEFLSGYSLI